MKVNDIVTVNEFLTSDPHNKRGRSGKILLIEDDEAVVRFSDGYQGKYKTDALELNPFLFNLISRPYKEDYLLFNSLGFLPFETYENEEVFVGEYKFPHYDIASAKVWVTCMPAQFWKIEVKKESGDIEQISTGSGCLSEYWKSIELFATNMLVVETCK